MKNTRKLISTGLMTSIVWLSACASTPPPENKTQNDATPAADEKEPVWSVPSEAEVASKLDRDVEKAAKSYVQLKKDGVLMFCKRYRNIGSNIPTIKCITEAQLREDVENMTRYRQEMMNKSGKCTLGAGGGGGPCSAQ